MVINSLSAMLLAILCKNILWYENRKNEKRNGRQKERKENTNATHTFYQIFMTAVRPLNRNYHHGERFW